MVTLKVYPISEIAKSKNIELSIPFTNNIKMFVIDHICYESTNYVCINELDNKISFAVEKKDVYFNDKNAFIDI